MMFYCEANGRWSGCIFVALSWALAPLRAVLSCSPALMCREVGEAVTTVEVGTAIFPSELVGVASSSERSWVELPTLIVALVAVLAVVLLAALVADETKESSNDGAPDRALVVAPAPPNVPVVLPFPPEPV